MTSTWPCRSDLPLVDALRAAGDRYLWDLEPSLARADPGALVEPRSRKLCAALGLLAESAYHALGERRKEPEWAARRRCCRS